MIVSKQERDALRAALALVPRQPETLRSAAVQDVTNLLDTCDALEQGVPVPQEALVVSREYLVRSARGFWRVMEYQQDTTFEDDHGPLYPDDVQVVFALPTLEGR